ncbi:hypothetical protein [Kordia sp.]|uniref:hypothetical protein n=1 Tax=Kordia sp. TaxID=1965332 RepID=UPI003D6AD898
MSRNLLNKITGNTLWVYFEARNSQDNFSANDIIHKVEQVMKHLKLYYNHLSIEKNTIIETKIQAYFQTTIFKSWILNQSKDLKDVINTDIVNRHKRNFSNPTKKEYLDFYAIYCGFAGINGFIANESLYNCFLVSSNEEKFQEKSFLKRLIYPDIGVVSTDVLLQKYQAKEDFYKHYTGFYNVFFIDEVTVFKKNQGQPPKFEVANFIFENHKGKFFYKELDTEKLKYNDLFPLENSPKSNFYVQEIDVDWAYMFSFKRPDENEGILDEFSILQLGSTQEGYQRFAGIGFAVRVKYPFELILPRRDLDTLDANLFRICSPVTSVSINKKNNTERNGDEIYAELFKKGKLLTDTIKNELPRIEKILRLKANLYYEEQS